MESTNEKCAAEPRGTDSEMGPVGAKGPYGGAGETDLVRYLISELKRKPERIDWIHRDKEGNTYFPIDRYVAEQAEKALGRYLSMIGEEFL